MTGMFNAHKIDGTSFNYIFEQDVPIPIQSQRATVRCNVYRPKTQSPVRFPVLVTYGPYGKDIHYSKYVKASLILEIRY